MPGGIDPVLQQYLRQKEDERLRAQMQREGVRDAANLQSEQALYQNLAGAAQSAASAAGSINGQQAPVRQTQIQQPDIGKYLQSVEPARSAGVDPKIFQYLKSKQESPLDKLRKQSLELDIEKKQRGLGRGSRSGVTGGGVTGGAAGPSFKGNKKQLSASAQKSLVQASFTGKALDELEKTVMAEKAPTDWAVVGDTALGALLPESLEPMGRRVAGTEDVKAFSTRGAQVVEGLLKAMSGAASTQYETEQYRNMFTPLAGESKERHLEKIRNARAMNEVLKKTVGMTVGEARAEIASAITQMGVTAPEAQPEAKPGMVRIKQKSDGRTGSISQTEWDAMDTEEKANYEVVNAN